MSYDQTVPATGHSGSQDYSAMQGNFTQIQTSFSVDHKALASGGATEGYHKQVHLVAASDPAKVASTGIAYSKTTGGHTEFFYEGEVTTGSILQITNQNLAASSGEGMCPGGLQIKCGQAATPTPVSFGANVFPTACISVVACPDNTGAQVNIISKNAGGFTAKQGGSPGGVISYYWIAIGY